jgi:isoleucyl-tRNA synthetase
MTEALKNEGIARELVNRIQNIRKDSGFEVTDTIQIVIETSAALEQAIKENEAYIKSETLAHSLLLASEVDSGQEIEFDNIKTRILISK